MQTLSPVTLRVHTLGAILALLLPMAVTPVSAALVAWWPLDSNANDASGNGHHGTQVGDGITFGLPGANGATGGAAHFAGTGHFDVLWAPELNTQSFTVSLWANASAAGGTYRSPITNRDESDSSGTYRHGWIVYNNNQGLWAFWNGGGPASNGFWNSFNGGPVEINEWHHIAVTYDYDSNTKSIYIDGVLAASTRPAAFSPNDGTAPTANPSWIYQNEDMHIGGGGDTGMSLRWEGGLDDIVLFDEALSQQQIQHIMRNSIPEPRSFRVYWGRCYSLHVAPADRLAHVEGLGDPCRRQGGVARSDPADGPRAPVALPQRRHVLLPEVRDPE